MTDPRRVSRDVVRLADVRRQLRRARRPVILGAMLGLDLGILLLLSQPRIYVATTDVLVADISLHRPTAQAPRPKNLTLDTEAQRMKSVALEVFGSSSLEDVAVTALPGTKVLRVLLNGGSDEPQQVSERASDLAAAYLRARLNSTRAERTAELDRLAATEEGLRQQLAELTDDAVGSPAARLVTIRGLRERLDELRRRQRLLLTATGDVGRVLRGPSTTGPAWQNPTVAPTSGLLLGAFTGYAWSSVRRRRVQTADDLKRLTRSLVLTAPGDGPEAPITRQLLSRLGATTRGDLPLLPVDDGPLRADLVEEVARQIGRAPNVSVLSSQHRPTGGGVATVAIEQARPVLGPAVTTPAGTALAAASGAVVLIVPHGTAEESVRSANEVLEVIGTTVVATVFLDQEGRS